MWGKCVGIEWCNVGILSWNNVNVVDWNFYGFCYYLWEDGVGILIDFCCVVLYVDGFILIY